MKFVRSRAVSLSLSLARSNHRSVKPRTSDARELVATELNDVSRVSSRLDSLIAEKKFQLVFVISNLSIPTWYSPLRRDPRR